MDMHGTVTLVRRRMTVTLAEPRMTVRLRTAVRNNVLLCFSEQTTAHGLPRTKIVTGLFRVYLGLLAEQTILTFARS